MPALFPLGLHQALVAVQDCCERLLAFLNDIYVVCAPEHVADIHRCTKVRLNSGTEQELCPRELKR